MLVTRQSFIESVLRSSRADLVGISEKILITRLLLYRLGEPDRFQWFKKPVFSPEGEAAYAKHYPATHQSVRVALALNVARARERIMIKPQETVTLFAMRTHAEEILARAERALVESTRARETLFQELRDFDVGGRSLAEWFQALGALTAGAFKRVAEAPEKPAGEGPWPLGPIKPSILEKPEGLGDTFRVLLAGFCSSGPKTLVLPYYDVGLPAAAPAAAAAAAAAKPAAPAAKPAVPAAAAPAAPATTAAPPALKPAAPAAAPAPPAPEKPPAPGAPAA